MIVTREQWGAREPRAVNRIHTPTRHLVLHYFDADWPGMAGTRRCQDLHMGKGWYDIAYSLTADSEAIYMGRGPGVQGAHTPQWNTRAHAVAAQVSGKAQPDGLLDRLAEAAVWLHEQGAVTEPRYTGGHRDYSSTACPGNWLYQRIPEINARAARLTSEDTMTPEQEAKLDRVLELAATAPRDVWTFDLPHAANVDKLPAWRWLGRLFRTHNDVDAFADAVVERLPDGADAATVREAVRSVFADAAGG